MKLRGFICCVALLGSQPVLSATLEMHGPIADLKTSISGITFPSRLPQDLKSGLTTKILIRLELLHDSQIEAQTDVLVVIRYDLWEEIFSVTESSGASTLLHEELGTVGRVMSFLSDISVPNAFGLEKRPASKTYRLRAHILLNPIEKERLDNLKQWVAENAGAVGSVTAGAAGTLTPGVSAPAGAPAPNSLFNRIFRDYSGTGPAATWLETVESEPFRVEDLIHDRE